MSGGKKSKKKPNLGIEFFYKLFIKSEFQKDLSRVRKQLCIPEKGFSNNKHRMWWIENNFSKMIDLMGVELRFKTKYDIPMPYMELVDDYIFFGKAVNHLKHKAPVAILHPTKEDEKLYREFNEPFTTMLIFGNATKTQVVDYIKKNWREIEMEKNKGHRTRLTLYKDRNQTIRELWKVPLKELQKEANSTSGYKDILISKILVKRGFVLTELSPGYIRKVANQK